MLSMRLYFLLLYVNAYLTFGWDVKNWILNTWVCLCAIQQTKIGKYVVLFWLLCYCICSAGRFRRNNESRTIRKENGLVFIHLFFFWQFVHRILFKVSFYAGPNYIWHIHDIMPFTIYILSFRSGSNEPRHNANEYMPLLQYRNIITITYNEDAL